MTDTPLRDRFIKWVEGYASKSCLDGCLPLPAQEREIALFAEVARALAVPQPEPDRIVANEDCLNCVCRDDQLCRGTEPRKAPQPAPLGREALDPMKLCDEWQGSQRRHSGFAIDELNAFMAGVKAADAILASTPAPSAASHYSEMADGLEGIWEITNGGHVADDFRVEVLAALRSLPAPSVDRAAIIEDWHPMETAPREPGRKMDDWRGCDILLNLVTHADVGYWVTPRLRMGGRGYFACHSVEVYPIGWREIPPIALAATEGKP